jgi:2-polyprenyl-6-methoxyphenol hydroxylase-like FAD-dependent oxidoreductase
MRQADVVVAGGGFTGLLAAIALSSAGMRVTVLEAVGSARGGFRGELIHPPGVRALAALGVLESFLALGAERLRGFAVFDDPRERVTADPVLLPYADASGGGIALDHESMLACLRRELARRPRVRVVLGARVEAVAHDGPRVARLLCADGSAHPGALVLGADGRHSRVRRLLQIPAESSLLSYTLAATIDAGLLPVAGHGHVFVGPLGPVLAYPCGRRARACIDVPSSLRGRDAMIAGVREHHAPRLPPGLRRALLVALEGAPLVAAANHAVSTRACAVPGAALIGDAAGCAHPLAATGMTSALHDVMTLRDCLMRQGLCDDALVTYQRRRYRFARAREVFAHALYEVLRAQDAGAAAVRDGVFRYWRGDERGRRASMGILSGDDARMAPFLLEYSRIVGASGCAAGLAGLRTGGVRAAGKSMAAVLATARDCMAFAATKAVATVRTERTAMLETFICPRGASPSIASS